MTDELITNLAKVSSLRVISRTSVMRYKATKKSLPEIARELNVDGIVEGSVTRSGDKVRITAQLIRGNPTDQHLWAESYERPLGDVLRLQNEVAQAITQQVRAQLSPQQQSRLHLTAAVNPEAYDAYLRGRYYLTRDSDTAKNYFEEAIRKTQGSPRPMPAWQSLTTVSHFALVAPEPAHKLAERAARKALELDGTSGQAHTVLAVLKWRYDWDSPAAEREFASALSLAPNYDCLHSYYAS